MTQQRIRILELSEDEQAALDRNLTRLNAKADRNLLRASYYDSHRVARLVSPVVPPVYQRLALVLGWPAKAVDALARRCNLDDFVWPDGNLNDLGFRELWDANMVRSETNQGITSALIHAASFAVATKGDEGEPPALIHFRDAMNATGTWNPRRRGLDDFLSVTARSGDTQRNITGFVLYLDGVTISVVKDRTQKGGWAVDRSEHPWGVPAEPLVYRPRLGRPLGSSRISRPVMSLTDQALREVMRAEGHMDVFSFPDYWLLGADESVFGDKAAWQVVLGRLRALPDDEDAAQPRADIKRFTADSPEPHVAWLNALAKLFARETSLPDSAVAITDLSNPTSAESYDAAQYELIAEAEGATDDFAPALRRIMVKALAMANGENEIPAAWSSIDTKWRDPRFLSRAAEADAGSKQIAAVPWLAETSVGLELLGLDDQQAKRAIAEKARAQSVAALSNLAALAGAGQQSAAPGVAGS